MTISEAVKDELKRLYRDSSKHSVYQNIPAFVQEQLEYHEPINEEWRGDTARYQYILSYIQERGFKSVADVGSNTGFFTHSLAHQFPQTEVTAIEPNSNHCTFIETINRLFKLANVQVENVSLGLEQVKSWHQKYDCTLLLNVLHHAGVDYDQALVPSVDQLSSYIDEYLRSLRIISSTLIYQLGYNWGGNKQTPFIPPNNVSMMSEYLLNSAERSGWKVDSIAFYSRDKKEYIRSPFQLEGSLEKWIEYEGIQQNSEFYKRPILILVQ